MSWPRPIEAHLLTAVRRVDNDAGVDLWRCSLDLPPASLQENLALLSDDELARAERYKFALDRDRFVAAHAFLRMIISHYLSVRPENLSFVYGAFGKPGLPAGLATDGLEFNLSHSGGLAVLGLAWSRRIGVDIERVSHVSDLHSVAARFFASSETSRLQALPADLQEFAFYCCWTRKEAFLKALGDGLTHPLDSFAVSLHKTDARLLDVRDDPNAPSRWALHHVNVEPGYVTALAVERCGAKGRRPSRPA